MQRLLLTALLFITALHALGFLMSNLFFILPGGTTFHSQFLLFLLKITTYFKDAVTVVYQLFFPAPAPVNVRPYWGGANCDMLYNSCATVMP